MRKLIALSLLLMLVLLSCTISTVAPSPIVITATTDNQLSVDQALVGTFQAQTQLAGFVQQTLGAMPTSTPSLTPNPSNTYTPEHGQLTLTTETNCRSGPGTSYPALGAIQPGQVAVVLGRSWNSDNYIVQLPSNPAITCWVWANYATVTGNTSTIPVFTPPPSPTPAGPFNLTIVNNTATTIFYLYVELHTAPDWGPDRLGVSTISSGGGSFVWTVTPGKYDVKVENNAHGVMKTWMQLDIYAPMTLTVP